MSEVWRGRGSGTPWSEKEIQPPPAAESQTPAMGFKVPEVLGSHHGHSTLYGPQTMAALLIPLGTKEPPTEPIES